jgi:hypothetical protein
MSRMFTLAGVGFVAGLLTLWALFTVCVPDPPRERPLWFAFSVMGAIPVSAMFALFGAVKSLQDEMKETRREMKHWQSMFDRHEDDDKPSTQFKSGLPKCD